MEDVILTSEQEEKAQQLFQLLQEAFLSEARRLARFMVSKPDEQLLGKTEFQVRDSLHRLGAETIQTALAGRKKGGTKDQV